MRIRNTKRGNYGHYTRTESTQNAGGERELVAYVTSGRIALSEGLLSIKSSDIAPFVTELIEMARVLGVTGGQDGR